MNWKIENQLVELIPVHAKENVSEFKHTPWIPRETVLLSPGIFLVYFFLKIHFLEMSYASPILHEHGCVKGQGWKFKVITWRLPH